MSSDSRYLLGWFLKGAVIGALASFPLAALCVLLFRFPIPFAGYQRGPEALKLTMMAVVFYGAIGGFVVQALLGGMGGLIGARLGAPDGRRIRTRAILLATLGSAVGVIALAGLDLVIGPW